jgi:hypothetical protein
LNSKRFKNVSLSFDDISKLEKNNPSNTIFVHLRCPSEERHQWIYIFDTLRKKHSLSFFSHDNSRMKKKEENLQVRIFIQHRVTCVCCACDQKWKKKCACNVWLSIYIHVIFIHISEKKIVWLTMHDHE